MDMLNWAKNEVKIACEKEHPDLKEGEWDYGCACYQSALKAYESLINDDHSGFSWNMTASILNRLMRNIPLTPIEDTDDIWNRCFDNDNHTTYQCIRRSSLFKNVYNDGHVEYHDNDQFICIDIHSGCTYSSGLVRKVIGKKFPIIFPYIPGDQIKVYCEDFLTDPKNGDFDTVGIIYCISKDGKEDIGKYFKESSNDIGWEEINFDEYANRKIAANKLKESNYEI